MTSNKNPLDLLARLQSDEQLEFAEALEAIRTAASLLSRPEVVACLAFLRDTANAVGSVGEALRTANLMTSDEQPEVDPARATLYEAVHLVPMQDAVKAVAVQDISKAVAIQHAVKTMALREAAKSQTFTDDEIRSIVSSDTARAISLMREMDLAAQRRAERRVQGDRRKHH